MLKLARHASSSAKPPTALLMMNMGGPKDQDGVYPFLANLFSDPDLIPLGPLQKQIAPWIAYRRTPSIKKQYAAMGGGSPIGSWTQIQGEELAKSMDIASPETGMSQH